MNPFKRGFITVATGDYFCYLAENLYMSYVLFSDHKYPMYVITDDAGARRMNKLFDGCIVMKEPHYGFLDKIEVYENSPFEETIFLDADMNITKDIDFLFDLFSENKSDISCIGTLKEITCEQRPIHYSNKTIEIFGFDKFISFGGGIYYYLKSERASSCMEFIKNCLISNYKEYGLILSGNRMTDEALIEVGMLKYKFMPLQSKIDIMKYHRDMMKSLKWDLKSRECSFMWWEDQIVHPAIIHYGNSNTRTIKYIHLNNKVRGMYYRQDILTVGANNLKMDYELIKPLVTERIKERVKKILPNSIVIKIAKVLHGKKVV